MSGIYCSCGRDAGENHKPWCPIAKLGRPQKDHLTLTKAEWVAVQGYLYGSLKQVDRSGNPEAAAELIRLIAKVELNIAEAGEQ